MIDIDARITVVGVTETGSGGELANWIRVVDQVEYEALQDQVFDTMRTAALINSPVRFGGSMFWPHKFVALQVEVEKC